MFKLLRLQMIVLLAFIMFFVTYAFASSDTNSFPKSGESAAQISGWNITNVRYQLSEYDHELSAVVFDLDGPASQVLIRFDNASDRAFNCYNVDGFHWSCKVDGVELARINSLRVIATN
jgi:hypothetical protein